MRRNLTIALAAAVLLACSLWLLLGRSPVDSDPEREGSARAQQEDGSSSLPEATEGEGEPAAIPDGSALLVTDAASIDLEAGTAGIRGTVRDVAGEPAAAAEVTLYRSRLPADIEEEGGLPLFRLLRSNSFAAFGMPWRGARSGASTSIRFRDEILHGLDPLARVVTDDAGEYLFEGVEDGRYLVAGHGSGTLDTPSTGISYLQGSQETVDLILEAAGSLTGAVVDPGGAPVTHAEVRITGLMVQPESGFEGMFVTRDELLLYLLNPISAEAGTDATGAFSFHGLPALEYQVWVEALPFAAAERTQPVPEDAPLEVVLEPGAVITGVVEGPGGRGLADAGVRLTQDQSGGFRGRDWTRLPLEREGTTGPEGEFTIGGLPEGRYRLSARLGGYQEQEIRGMQLEAGEERQVVLSLELGEVIQGIVQDGEGNPLASVDVRADARRQGRRGPGGWGFPGSGSRGETESDERGRFIIDTLEAGEYRLRFDLEGWAPLTLDAATGGDPVEALLTRGRVLSGRIVSAGETGIERARLSLQRRGSRRRRTVSDEGGRFRIPGLEEGTFTLLVEARGYRTLREEVRSSDGDLGDLALDEAIAIHGVVLGPDGNPLAGARVVGELETEESADAGRDPRRGGVRRRGRGSMGGMGGMGFRRGFSARSRVSAWSGGEGAFRLELPAADGEWGLSASYPLLLSGEQTVVEVRGGTVDGVVLQLRWGAMLTGTVVGQGGVPVIGARLQLLPAGRRSRRPAGRARSRDLGEFQMTGLAEGTFQLRTTARGYARSVIEEVVLPESGQTRLTVALEREKRLVGRVLDPEGYAVPGARVSVRRGRSGGDTTVTGPSGEFEIGGLAEGEVQLSVRASGFRRWQRDGIVAGGEAVDVILERALVVEGVVFDHATLEPIARARIGVVAPSAEGERRTRSRRDGDFARSDSEGRFRLDGLAPGEWTVTVSVRNYITLETEPLTLPLPPGEELSLGLRAGAHVSGRLVDFAGRGIEGATISATVVSAEEDGPGSSGSDPAGRARRVLRTRRAPRVRSEADGTFRLSGLEDGQYRLRVEHTTYLLVEREVEVEAGGAGAEVFITLERGGEIDGRVYSAQGQRIVDGFAHLQGGEPAMRRRVRLDEEGHFYFGGLSAGSYQVHYTETRRGPHLGEKQIEIRARGRIRLDLRL